MSKSLERKQQKGARSIVSLPVPFPTKAELPSYVPTALTSFVGRKQHIADLCDLLLESDIRLLTLVGIGGIGKTRLAMEVAQQLLRLHLIESITFLSLASLTSPALLPSALAEALNITTQDNERIVEYITDRVGSQTLLLVLDNFEHFLSMRSFLENLMLACPPLKLLITSRVALHIPGEHLYPVPPLDIPNLKQMLAVSEELRVEDEAVLLFAQRAKAVLPSFRLTPTNVHLIAEICTQLDGLPLAIELAATRINVLSPKALLQRLAGLKDTPHTPPVHSHPIQQHTLHDALQWSYDFLSLRDQQVFRVVSIFVSSWTIEAAEAVWAQVTGEVSPLLDEVAHLLNHGLLQHRDENESERRFSMLATVRDYGQERLQAHEQVLTVQSAAIQYFLSLGEEAEPYLRGDRQRLWRQRLEQEMENIRAALQWSIEQHKVELALRFCIALWRFWRVGSYLTEGRYWMQATLQLPDTEEIFPLRAKALYGAGNLELLYGDEDQARRYFEESVTLCRALGEKQQLALVLGALAWIFQNQGDSPAAHELIDESITLARSVGDTFMLASSLRAASSFLVDQGDAASARPLAEESVALWRKGDDQRGLIRALDTLGVVVLAQGDLSRAVLVHQEALALAKASADTINVARTLYRMISIYRAQGDLQRALQVAEESFSLAQEVKSKDLLARLFLEKGDLLRLQGHFEQALELAQQSLSQSTALNDQTTVQFALFLWGNILLAKGEASLAIPIYEEGLQLAFKLSLKQHAAALLSGLVRAFVAQGKVQQAASFVGAAEALFAVEQVLLPDLKAAYEQAVAQLVRLLGKEQMTALREKGRRLSQEELLAFLKGTYNGENPVSALLPTRLGTNELTPRQLEILRLVSQGLTDVEIAQQLSISVRTVNTHLTNIYQKIGVTSRSGATRYVFENRLL